jgi:uncharacterized protein (TIGR02466 family)
LQLIPKSQHFLYQTFELKPDKLTKTRTQPIQGTIKMQIIRSLFATRLFKATLGSINLDEFRASCYSIAEDDEAGNKWCEANDFPGYTSYASLTDLPWRFPIFGEAVKKIDKLVADFAVDLELDLDGRKLVLEDIWINILPEGGIHTSHIHPHSVISGTTYVKMPENPMHVMK